MKKLMMVLALVLSLVSFGALADDAAATKHEKHPIKAHKHKHKKNCGHKAEKHGDHTDYEDKGHHHKKHGAHYDECHGPEGDAKGEAKDEAKDEEKSAQ